MELSDRFPLSKYLSAAGIKPGAAYDFAAVLAAVSRDVGSALSMNTFVDHLNNNWEMTFKVIVI